MNGPNLPNVAIGGCSILHRRKQIETTVLLSTVRAPAIYSIGNRPGRVSGGDRVCVVINLRIFHVNGRRTLTYVCTVCNAI